MKFVAVVVMVKGAVAVDEEEIAAEIVVSARIVPVGRIRRQLHRLIPEAGTVVRIVRAGLIIPVVRIDRAGLIIPVVRIARAGLIILVVRIARADPIIPVVRIARAGPIIPVVRIARGEMIVWDDAIVTKGVVPIPTAFKDVA